MFDIIQQHLYDAEYDDQKVASIQRAVAGLLRVAMIQQDEINGLKAQVACLIARLVEATSGAGVVEEK